MIEVNANYFRAAAECQSTDSARYYLNGVRIAPHPVKGIILTATDGHRLICLHDEHGACESPKIVSIDPKVIDARAISILRRELTIKKTKAFEAPKIQIDEAGIVTFGTYRSLRSRFIDGNYPDWLKVVRPILEKAEGSAYSPGSYNQRLIAEFGKIAAMLSPNGGRSAIRVISISEAEPSLVKFSGVDFAFGILMPMKSTITNEIPAWMKPILESVT